MVSKLILISLLVSYTLAATTAECVIRQNNSSGVSGKATFVLPSGDGDEVDVSVNVTGNKDALVGFYINENSIISTQNCEDSGQPYNPYGKSQGDRTDVERRVGDLGNIQIIEGKALENNFTDNIIKITGTTVENIVGKTCMVHSEKNDKSVQTADSTKTGKLACGTVILTNASSSFIALAVSLLLTVLLI